MPSSPIHRPARVKGQYLGRQAERNLESKVIKQIVQQRKRRLADYLPSNTRSLRSRHPSVMKRLDKIMLLNPTTINSLNKTSGNFNKMEEDLVTALSTPAKPRKKPTNSSLGAYWKATEGKRVSKPKKRILI
jgi:hypothetical protein